MKHVAHFNNHRVNSVSTGVKSEVSFEYKYKSWGYTGCAEEAPHILFFITSYMGGKVGHRGVLDVVEKNKYSIALSKITSKL